MLTKPAVSHRAATAAVTAAAVDACLRRACLGGVGVARSAFPLRAADAVVVDASSRGVCLGEGGTIPAFSNRTGRQRQPSRQELLQRCFGAYFRHQ